MNIRISTDSTADIPVALREELNINVMPIILIVDGKEYRDGYDITPREFYDFLENSKEIPTHSQINPQQFLDLYEETYAQGYEGLIHTCINAKGSSTYQNAISARELFYSDHPEAETKMPIVILDGGTYSMGYGWPVVEGARMAQNGASVGEVAAHIQDLLDHIRVAFVSLDLRFAKKSGRISAAAAFLGDALGLKPIIDFEDGASKILSKVRGEKNAINALVDLCLKERKPGTPFLCIRGKNPEQSEYLLEQCRAKLGGEPEIEYEIGCVIAINSGPRLVGLVYQM